VKTHDLLEPTKCYDYKVRNVHTISRLT